MRKIRIITLVALLVGMMSSVALADPHVVYDRERGELSIGTGAPSRAALMQAIDSASPSALTAMLEYGERVECYQCVPRLERKLLESGDPRVREIAAWWLRRRYFAIGGIVRNMRTVLVTDADATRRSRAAEALGEFLDPKSFEPLSTAATDDSSAEVRASAVRALGRLNHPASSDVFGAALEDDDVSVRRAALGVVLRVNFFREHDALVGRLADDDAGVRKQAALLVGHLRVASAVPALAALLRGEEDRDVRQAAAWALGRVGGSDARTALVEVRETETDSLVRDAIDIAIRMTS